MSLHRRGIPDAVGSRIIVPFARNGVLSRAMLWILVSNKGGRERFLHRAGRLEFGRGPQRDVPRRTLLDPTVSTNQLCIEELENGRLRLTNLSARVKIRLADGSLVEPGAEFCAVLPTRLHMGDTLIEFEVTDRQESSAGSIS